MVRGLSICWSPTFLENRFNGIKKPLSRCASRLARRKRTAFDYLGSALARNWKRSPATIIDTVESGTLSDAMNIFHSSFDTISDPITDSRMRRYSAIFRHIFYTAKLEDRVVGYCANCVKLSPSRCGLRKIAVVYSFAVDRRHRRQGIGTQLLETTLREMRLHRIDEIRLYVNTNNTPALLLYLLFGFRVVREVLDVCGRGERCYEMKLAF